MTPPDPSGQGPDPERVLTQALRAMAGGGKESREPSGAVGRRPSLTVVQILLIAAIVGLLAGTTVGLISLLT
ncbi:hypothetical protein ABIB25_001583 [Nakamurella sp. UYEF19]|uniref:hypothetical protein n=1 Tax=Nakamurella sp. UYEF19 TaxID=1756392 RepID=UPI0033998D35